MAAIVDAGGSHLAAPQGTVEKSSGSGLYRPEFEHDACGVAFVADLHGRPSHAMVEMGLASLCHLEHRGAKGADPETGDGAGVLVQVPDRFLRAVFGVELPPLGSYATGIAFLPADGLRPTRRAGEFEALAARKGLSVLAWRDVPVEAGLPGAAAREVMPSFRQVVVAGERGQSGLELDRTRLCVAQAGGARDPGHLLRFFVGPHPRLQGDVDGAAAARVLPRPFGPALRIRAGAGARPFFDQYVPELAAGPPVPVRGAQRRVQHRAGQPQLDADPRGDAGQPAGPRRYVPDFPGRYARRQRLDELRRGARAAPPQRPVAAARGAR